MYELKDGEAQPVANSPGQGQGDSLCFAINKELLARGSTNRIEVCGFNGAVRTAASFEEGQGVPLLMDIGGDTLAVASTRAYLKVFKLISGREMKPVGAQSGRRLEMRGQQVNSVETLRVNSNGTKVALLAHMDPAPGQEDEEESARAVLRRTRSSRSRQGSIMDPDVPMPQLEALPPVALLVYDVVSVSPGQGWSGGSRAARPC